MAESFALRELGLEEVRPLYEERLKEDFPPNELKPLWAIERALEKGEYACYGAARGEDLLAYAFFVVIREGEARWALFDYYAVRRDLRDRGVGSAFIQALVAGPLRDMDCVLLEVDDPAFAPDPAELETRRRRLDFYLRNGLTDTSVTATVYGADFRILALPVGAPLAPGETRRVYGALYRAMMPPRIYARMVDIH